MDITSILVVVLWWLRDVEVYELAPIFNTVAFKRVDYSPTKGISRLSRSVPPRYREGIARSRLAVPAPLKLAVFSVSVTLDARFHADTRGWPHQLYIRVARRWEKTPTPYGRLADSAESKVNGLAWGRSNKNPGICILIFGSSEESVGDPLSTLAPS